MNSDDIFIDNAQPPADPDGNRFTDAAANGAADGVVDIAAETSLTAAYETAKSVMGFDEEDGESDITAAEGGTESLLDALREGAEEAAEGVIDALGNAASVVGDFLSGL